MRWLGFLRSSDPGLAIPGRGKKPDYPPISFYCSSKTSALCPSLALPWSRNMKRLLPSSPAYLLVYLTKCKNIHAHAWCCVCVHVILESSVCWGVPVCVRRVYVQCISLRMHVCGGGVCMHVLVDVRAYAPSSVCFFVCWCMHACEWTCHVEIFTHVNSRVCVCSWCFYTKSFVWTLCAGMYDYATYIPAFVLM
jgi:hypothetical protein